MGHHLLRNEKTHLGWEWFVNSFSIDPHIPHPGQTGMRSPKHPFFRGKERYSQGPRTEVHAVAVW